ncbi:unnamed protein product [Cylindrotheca closterium]|uniref:thiopurine S-methyltransferase n=1 Tax=Cylindrotheca closterium TaxID=2856 RepID=A0AAD2FXR4_9STRA|nr:unnamed protein product [Cylindrotheca closterium]
MLITKRISQQSLTLLGVLLLALSVMVTADVADENSENLKPWLNRWESRQIGFHLSDVNAVLTKFADKLLMAEGEEDCSATRVFVPLCGKTLDMVYLASRAGDLYGVEGIKTALEEFAAEHPEFQLENKGTSNGFERFQGKQITLLKGDYFQLSQGHTEGQFDAVYDRGSLVAINPALRSEYVKVLGGLLAKGARILLVTYERIGTPEAMATGPPFSITETGVREIYEGLDWVESVTLLHKEDQLISFPGVKERSPGLDGLVETVYLIQAKK